MPGTLQGHLALGSLPIAPAQAWGGRRGTRGGGACSGKVHHCPCPLHSALLCAQEAGQRVGADRPVRPPPGSLGRSK